MPDSHVAGAADSALTPATLRGSGSSNSDNKSDIPTKDQIAITTEFTSQSLRPGGAVTGSSSWQYVPPRESWASPDVSRREIDITANFQTASKFIRPGELVKESFFELSDSIAAIEIMDPKMDSGYSVPGEPEEPDYDISTALTPQQVIGIMDELLCHEMAWHRGHPLSQTVLTSVYIEQLTATSVSTLDQAEFNCGSGFDDGRLVDVVLRAYCLGLAKSCDAVIQAVQGGIYFEDEDLTTHTFNRTLLDKFSSNEIGALIRNAIGYLVTLQAASDGQKLDEALAEALRQRLVFRLNFLAVAAQQCSVDHYIDFSYRAATAITTAAKTSHLAASVAGASSTKLQRRLNSTSPPRPIVRLSFAEAYTTALNLTRTGILAADVVNHLQSPEDLRHFLGIFGVHSPPPLCHTRSVVQTLLRSMDLGQWYSLIREELRHTSLAGSPILDEVNWTVETPLKASENTDPRPLWADTIDSFCETILPLYQDFLFAFCQNRTRMRRMLCHSVLYFQNIEAQIQQSDAKLASANANLDRPLQRWALMERIVQMETVVQLGFEQDVYLPGELGGMYWYLKYLLDSRLEVLRAMRPQNSSFAGDKTGSRPLIEDIDRFIMTVSVHSAAADALLLMYNTLSQMERIPTKTRDRSLMALRYELRMKPFLRVLEPGVPPFEQMIVDVYHPGGEAYGGQLSTGSAIVRGKIAESMEALSRAMDQIPAMRGPYIKPSEDKMQDVLESIVASLQILDSVLSGYTTIGPHCRVSAQIPQAKECRDAFWIVPVVTSESHT